jgi:two-component system LytT family sensor kinase
MAPQTVRYWSRIIGANVVASLLVVLVFSGVSTQTPIREMLEAFLVAFTFSSCISPLAGVAMPRAAPWIWSRLRFPFNWVAVVGVMIALAVVGSVAAISVLVAIGYLEPSRFLEWLGGSLKVAIVVTLTIGMFITVYEMLQGRLQATELALRTKERDEADARRIATEAQLASLESRVQPHFLFNTLNSISALIHEDPAGAERMTGQLAALMRSSLDQQPLVSIEDELQTVRNYLAIESVRFGDRLRFALDVPDGTTAVLVPRLSLQTLVENSIKFAVSPRRDGASVAIRAIESNGHVRLEVEDDGPGFDTSLVREGHGLELLRSRLAMTFGDRAALHVDSRAGRTCIAMEVPFESHPARPS